MGPDLAGLTTMPIPTPTERGQITQWLEKCEEDFLEFKPQVARLRLECLRKILSRDETKADHITDLEHWSAQIEMQAREMGIPITRPSGGAPVWAFLDEEFLRIAVLGLVLTFFDEKMGASVKNSQIMLEITPPKVGTSGTEIRIGWNFADWSSPAQPLFTASSVSTRLALAATRRHGFSLREIREGSQNLAYVFWMGRERIADFGSSPCFLSKL
ncbi:hypothetical protein WDW86_21555 [Bdellovibrionota bacterium FG-2]